MVTYIYLSREGDHQFGEHIDKLEKSVKKQQEKKKDEENELLKKKLAKAEAENKAAKAKAKKIAEIDAHQKMRTAEMLKNGRKPWEIKAMIARHDEQRKNA